MCVVFRGQIDNIVGIVFSKDLLEHIEGLESTQQQQPPQPLPLITASQLMEPAYYIPESMTAWTALQEMRKRRVHMAIVVDEYGGTAGLLTFEDILEEVP